MTQTPWLSVVIPVFRAEHSILQAITSVTDQKVQGVEIICVDDCSPDNSADVILSLQQKNPMLTLIRHSANQGPGPARNSGIDAATGDYIVFLDSDDSLIDGGLPALELLTRQSPDLVLVACEETRRGKTRSLTEGPLQQSLSRQPVTNVSDEPRILFWPPSPWSKVYRRQFLMSQDLRFGDGMGEDIPWSASVTIAAETVAVCDTPFYRYLTASRESSVTTTKSDKNVVLLAQVRAMREKIDLTALTPQVGSHLSALASIHLIWSNRAAYRLLPDGSHEDFFRESALELRTWLACHSIPPRLDCRPLMTPAVREAYARSLARGNWSRWQKMLRRDARWKKLRRMFRPRKPSTTR